MERTGKVVCGIFCPGEIYCERIMDDNGTDDTMFSMK